MITKNYWFVGSISRCPTNFTTPRRIAIEAPDLEAASKRLYRLYTDDYDRSSVRLCSAENSDDLHGALRHPAPTPL